MTKKAKGRDPPAAWNVYATWRDFWIRMSETPPHEVKPDDLERLVAFFWALPYFLTIGGAEALVDVLICFRHLRSVIEARGLDSAPLSRAEPVLLRTAEGPFRGWACKPDHVHTWPSLELALSAFAGKPKLSAAERDLGRAAVELVGRLTARLDLDPAHTDLLPAPAATAPAAPGSTGKSSGFLGAMGLAKECKIPKGKMGLLHTRLARFRQKHGQDRTCVLEVEIHGRRESQYLHALERVRPYIEDLAEPGAR
jgi:hypothetical protein